MNDIHPQPSILWIINVENLSLDYLRTDSQDVAQNKALHDINSVLKQHGLSCSMLGLSDPIASPPQQILFDVNEEASEAKRLIPMLNAQQFDAFTKIIKAIEDESESNRLFYLDGPGGSGKTFLYQAIMSFVRGRRLTALPFATTGIAGTLLKGGHTVHSGFKLPIPLLENSVSSMRLTSPEAAQLLEAVIIIIDEGSTLEKKSLDIIDLLLREICKNQKPF